MPGGPSRAPEGIASGLPRMRALSWPAGLGPGAQRALCALTQGSGRRRGPLGGSAARSVP